MKELKLKKGESQFKAKNTKKSDANSDKSNNNYHF
jgi:hypothetical protein